MKTLKFYILLGFLCLNLIFPAPGFCLFGVGDIVSDPTSYTYYVEQIQQSVKNFEELQKQLETAKETYAEVQDMNDQLTGAYNSAVGLVEDLTSIKDEIQTNPSAMLKYANKFLEQELKDGEYIDPEIILDEVFVDPRESKTPVDRLKGLHKKYQVRQAALGEAIKKAEKTIQATPEKIKEISDLAAKIDSTPNVKAAQDLTNRLLTEILKTLTDLVYLSAQIGEAQALVNFQGVDSTKTEQIEKDLEAYKDKRSSYRPMEDYLNKKGIEVDEDSSFQDDMKKISDIL